MLRKFTPHLIAIGIFLVLTLVYFSPMLSGKMIQQQDIMQWTGMSKEIVDFRAKHHTEPLWTNSMFCGMPAFQVSCLYPANLVAYINSAITLWLPSPAAYIFLALFAFYLLMISLGFDFRLAIAGAISFAFASYNFVIIEVGHNSKAHAIALIPLVIAGVLMAYNKKYLLGCAITSMALGLELYANHLQITYYLLITILLLAIAKLAEAVIKKTIPDFIKGSVWLLPAVVLGILPNISNLWVTYDYGKDSTRGQSELTEKKSSSGLDRDYAFSYSYGVSETFTLLIPRFHGGASVEELSEESATYKALMQNGVPQQQAKGFISAAPTYFGDMISTAGPPYAGAITCFFFILGIFIVKGAEKWWLIAATLLSFFLSWGENWKDLNYFFFDHFPGYNKFRAVSMILIIAQFTMPLLALLAASQLFKEQKKGTSAIAVFKKPLLYSFYIVGGFCLLLTIIPSLFTDFVSKTDEQLKQYDWLLSALRQDRVSLLRMDAFRSFFFIAAAFTLVWFFLKGKLKNHIVYISLAVLMLIDLWTVAKRYLNDDSFIPKSRAEKPFTPSPANQQILADPDINYRVMNTAVSTFNDATTSYYHKSIGGYHGAKLKRYQELIENQIAKNNMHVLDMLNTKYFIVKDNDGQPLAQRNPGALGAAWFVNDYKIVSNADAEMMSLDSLSPKDICVIDQRFQNQLVGLKIIPDSSASIKNTLCESNYLKYETKCSTEQLAVLSEIYYNKGWNAYIDGNPVPHFRANYVLRAMRIPSGSHIVEFKFEPTIYATGEKISLAGSAILFLFFGFAVYKSVKKEG